MQWSKNLQQLDHLSDINELLNSIFFFLGIHWIHSNNMYKREISIQATFDVQCIQKKFYLFNILIVDTSFLLIFEFAINVYGNTKLNSVCSWHGSLCPHLQLVQHFSVSNPGVSVWALWKWDTCKWPYITDCMICLSPHDDFSKGTSESPDLSRKWI